MSLARIEAFTKGRVEGDAVWTFCDKELSSVGTAEVAVVCGIEADASGACAIGWGSVVRRGSAVRRLSHEDMPAAVNAEQRRLCRQSVFIVESR